MDIVTAAGNAGWAGAHAAGVRLVHLDEALVVLSKPAGMLCVPGRDPLLAPSLAQHARLTWSDALIVHRLDMATSGLVVLGRGAAMQRALSIAFAQRRVHKRYEAVVQGLIEPEAPTVWASIELPLIADWPRRPRQKICFEHGKPSLTRYRVLARDEGASRTRVELEPVTGRSHQLRVHLAATGHPIVGDALYAPDDAAPRLLLHATRLGLSHPLTGQDVAWCSPPEF